MLAPMVEERPDFAGALPSGGPGESEGGVAPFARGTRGAMSGAPPLRIDPGAFEREAPARVRLHVALHLAADGLDVVAGVPDDLRRLVEQDLLRLEIEALALVAVGARHRPGQGRVVLGVLEVLVPRRLRMPPVGRDVM